MAASIEQRTERKLDSEKAQRIVEAMRVTVGRYGAAAATFDRVAREAGVSRGLLHYYFGTKERLLAETVRHDAALRMAQLEERLSRAHSLDGIVEALVTQLEDYVHEDRDHQAVQFEMFSASRRNDEVREQLARLYAGVRANVAQLLSEKDAAGVIELRADPEAVASVLFALGDGFELQFTAAPDWDSSAALEAGIRTARFLLGAPE
ncbi:MAG: TetR/AcrR family transcriptional regulator [Thermoleophilaceae bacterium]